MASNQQPYGYPPPPPPPAAQSGTSQTGYSPYNPQAAYGPPHQTNGRGRGGGGRGRGGSFSQGGRGDFQNQYNPQAGAYGYGGAASAVTGGGYGAQNPASYGPQPPASGYPSGPPPQWQHDHHQQPTMTQAAPQPVPLSAQNYHPNYAPQVYQSQPTVYGQPQQQNAQAQAPPLHQQQAPYQNSPQPPSSYTQSATSQPPLPGTPQAQQQWGAPQHQQTPQTSTPFNSGRGGRGRGGGYQGRGGYDAPLMGPPIRMGFDNDHTPQASNHGFPPFTPSQHGSPPVNISPSPYPNNGYRPQDYSQRGGGGHRGGYNRPPDQNSFYGNNSRGGRGGFQNQRGNFGNRGNRGDMNGFKRFNNNRDFRSYSLENRSQSASESVNDLPQKPNATNGTNGDGKKKKQKKKRKTNTLGLTPGTGDNSDTEDDADEESRLASLVMGATLMPADLQSWLNERKKKWPTAAIREAKAAELAKRREQAREQSLRDKAKAQKEREERAAMEAKLAQVQKAGKESKKSKKHTGETKLERQQRKAEKLRQQLEKAERKIQNTTLAGSKRKREAGDDGDNIKQEDQTGDQEAEEDSSDSDSSDSSDSGSDEESEPEPDVQSSRNAEQQKWSFKPHPLLHTKPCKYFSSGGTCGKMNKCRFIHDQAARDASLKERARDGGRVSLAELLLQNEQDKENLTVLKAIQYVAENGLLDGPRQPGTSANGQTADEKKGGDDAAFEAAYMVALQPPPKVSDNKNNTDAEMTGMA